MVCWTSKNFKAEWGNSAFSYFVKIYDLCKNSKRASKHKGFNIVNVHHDGRLINKGVLGLILPT